jgi:PAS domain S-box-containing protein
MIPGTYNAGLVALSVFIAIVASYAAFDSGERVSASGGQRRWAWLTSGAIVMGFGIWSMHYVGMLAFVLPVPVLYHVPTVTLSLVAAVAGAATALRIVCKETMRPVDTATAGICLGCAIVSMHYIGMAAMRSATMHHYKLGFVALSVVIAVTFSTLAAWLAFRFRSSQHGVTWTKINAASLMGVGIASMHYTGMAAAYFTPGSAPRTRHTVAVSTLGAFGIGMTTLLLLGTALITMWFDRRLQNERLLQRLYRDLQEREARIRRLVDANIIGIFTWNLEGNILEANDAFLRMVEYDRDDLLSGRMCWADLTPAEWRERDARATAELRETGRVQTYEKEFLRKDSSHVPALVGGALFEAGGNEGVAFVLDLSEQKRSEERYRTVVETASDAVITADESGLILFTNPATKRIFGYDSTELIGRPLTTLIPEFMRRLHEAGFNRHLATGQRHINWQGTELIGMRKNGEEFPLEISIGEQIRNGHRVFIGFIRDVGEKKRAEEALRRSEAYLSQAQRLAHIGSWAWQVPSRNALYISDEWYRIYGFDPKDGMPSGQQRLQRVHPEDRARFQAVMDRAIAEKSDYEVEFRILPPHSPGRYLHSVGHPVLGPSGKLLQFTCVSMDITESKQAEEAFRLIVVGTAATTGSDFFQSLVQHLAQALRARYAFVTTCDDQKHARTLAFWKDDGFGEDFDFDIADTPCEKVLHGEVCHYRQELRGLFPVDKFVADWQAESYLGVPMLDRSNRVIGHIAILDDKPMEADLRAIDLLKVFASRAAAELKRQRAEDELQAALQERERMREELARLAHLNRVSTMGQLAASLAHEIKQPISAAMTDANTCSRWLTRDLPDLPEAQAAASRVVKDVARASEIISRVRSLFKKESLQHEEVDINEVIQEMIALLQGESAKHSISIYSDIAIDLPPIMADRVQLQQVLMNLMLNGIQAMKSIKTPGKLTIKSQQDDSGQLLISVMDTGVGIPPEKMDQIFNAFFTSKPQGVGMGLAISRSIVESHGGRLWAVSNLESGATFHFTLPTRRNAHQAAKLYDAVGES